MEEGKNIFLLDGPIGRKKFIIFFVIMLAYSLLFILFLSIILGFIGVNIYTKIISDILFIIYFIILFYLIFINYSKRLWNIINCSKWKALLYVVLFFTALTAMEFIPILKYISRPIGFIFLICLFLIKGNLVSLSENTEKAQIVEGEQNQE